MNITVSYIADKFKLRLCGPDNIIKHLGLCNRNDLKDNTLSYVATPDYLKVALSNNNISALIIPEYLFPIADISDKSFLITEYPEDIFYEILDFIHSENSNSFPSTQIGKNCNIHKTAVIEDGVVIGDNVSIGAFTIIHANTTIGNNTTICSHCSIGSNGFQALKRKDGKSYNVNHFGGLVIGENCYIAEFVNISRALFDGEVIIGNNVLIDTHCHIAHECKIGDNSVLTTNTRLFGTSTIGKNVWMSPGTMVMNRITVEDGCHIAPGTFVMTQTTPNETYIGNPAIKKKNYISKELKLRKLLKRNS